MSLLGQRYASQEMKTIWSREFKIRSERDLWITVLKTQKRLGLEVSDEVISQYVRVKDVINLQSKSIPKHDILIAGFPCQPYSIAGLRKGLKDNRGQVFIEIIRILRLESFNPSPILSWAAAACQGQAASRWQWKVMQRFPSKHRDGAQRLQSAFWLRHWADGGLVPILAAYARTRPEVWQIQLAINLFFCVPI